LGHRGGPFWKNKDRAWDIWKGELEKEDEDIFEAAKREFEEESGLALPSIKESDFIPLGNAKLLSGKYLHIWAFEADYDVAKIKSNTFELEWPPRSGKLEKFPEMDRGEYIPIEEAKEKVNPALEVILDRLKDSLAERAG